MIFKTYETELDGISNKLGFSKRSFADWHIQVKKSFDEAGKGIKGFFSAIPTAFSVKNDDKNFKRIESSGEIVTKDNINSYISKLSPESANELAQQIVNIDKTKGSWQKYFKVLEKGNHSDVIDFIKNTDNLSKITGEDLVKANEAARQSALAHNAALQQQTLGARAATAAAGVLKTALSAIAYFAITQGISFIITKIDEVVNRAENAKKSAEELASTLKSANNSLQTQKDLIDRVEEDYEKLSKGVDSLGNNVSLSKEDFTDYQDICNQIAEYYPKLVSAWTKEGNAVVDLKNKVNDLKKAYEEERIAALNAFVAGADDIVNSYNLNANYSSSNGYDWTSGYKQKIAALQAYLDILTNMDKLEQGTEILNLLENGGEGFSGHDLQNALKDVDLSKYELDQLPSHLSAVIKNLQTELSQEDNSMKQMLINMFALDSHDYKNISDEAYQIGTSFINALDFSFFDSKNAGDYREFVDDLLDQLTGENADKISSTFNSLLNLDKEKDNITATEYKDRIDKIITDLQAYLGLDKNTVKLMVNAQIGDDDATFQNIDTMINNVKNKLQDEFDDKVGELSLTELQIAAEQIKINEDDLLSWDELKEKIEEAKKASDKAANSFDNLSEKITQIKESTSEAISNIKSFNDAIDKINNNESLSYDEVAELLELDPSIASGFTKTVDGYSIAVDELIAAKDRIKGVSSSNIEQDIADNTQEIADSEARIKKLTEERQKLYAEINANKDNDHYNGNETYERLLDIDEEIETLTNSIKNGQDLLSVLRLTLGEISESTSTMQQTPVSDLSSGSSKTFNWIETAIEKVSKAASRLGNIVSNTFKSWTDRNSALKKQISEVNKEIELQQKAYEVYTQKADSVGLSDYWTDKVRNGSIDISVITDEDLADKIDEYKEWYDKTQDCKEAVDELKESLSELYKTSFDNTIAKFSDIISEIDFNKSILIKFTYNNITQNIKVL